MIESKIILNTKYRPTLYNNIYDIHFEWIDSI